MGIMWLVIGLFVALIGSTTVMRIIQRSSTQKLDRAFHRARYVRTNGIASRGRLY